MIKYEIIKTSELSYFGRYEEKYLLKKTIYGIPFYTIGNDSILCILGAFILALGTIASIFNFIVLPTLTSIAIPAIMPILWYGWHFTAKRKFSDEHNLRKLIEAKITKSLNKNSDVIYRYIQKDNTVEINKFLK